MAVVTVDLVKWDPRSTLKEICCYAKGTISGKDLYVNKMFTLFQLKSTSVKKAPNQTPFFASTAILENNFLIRSDCLFLNHLDISLNHI